MGKGVRACPICPSCGSRKFRVVGRDEEQVTVECLSCSRRMVV